MKRKKLTSLIVCLAMLISLLPAMSQTASATSYPRTLKPGVRQSITVTAVSHTIDITLSDGKSGSSVYSKPGWVSISNPNASTYRVTVLVNTSNSSRSGSVVFKKNNKIYELTITQSGSPWTAISGLQTTTEGSIYKDEWNDYRAAQLTNFFNALINGGDTTAKVILNRAKPMATCYWTCLQAFTGYNGWSFTNQKYYGTPYQQSGRYIGQGFSVSDLTTSAADVNSYFYARGGSKGPGYGTDCSGYASYLGGTPWVKADEFAGQTSYFKKITDSSKYVSNIKSGDVLHRSGHVLMVVSVYRDGGVARGIVLMESRNRTTASGRNIYVFYESDEALKKLFGGISLSSCHTYIKNVVWGGTETAAGRTLKHIGTISDFVSSFGSHDLLSRK